MAGPSAPSKSISQILVDVLKKLEQRLGEQEAELKAAQSELKAERAARKKIEATSEGLVDLGEPPHVAPVNVILGTTHGYAVNNGFPGRCCLVVYRLKVPFTQIL